MTDQLEFRILQLEGVAEGFGFQLAGAEQKLVDGNGEQGLCQLLHPRLEEVLNVLACQHQQGFLLSVPFHQVADILNGGGVCQKEVQLIQCSHVIARAQQGVSHVGKDGEQQSVPEVPIELHDPLDPEH